ncbi:MAG: serine/threonine protein phosphatase [Saprospiraceae bacterium]|nr:serine/threonine protein phosphatase [Saprospiraceae bacterium]
MRRIAVTDIHGCKKTLESLLDRLALSQADHLYMLGDYVDRGPDSKGVIDLIWQLQRQGYPITCIRGNHEELVLRAASGNFRFLERWLLTDGKVTMDSFGVSRCTDIPQEYLDWMKNLPYFHEIDGYILVHAGLDFSLDDPLSDTTEMCWLRHWYPQIRYQWLGHKTILHGHTPVGSHVISEQLNHIDQAKYLDLDCGCVYANMEHLKGPNLGQLAAFDMDNRELFFEPFRG